ncbi:MAG: amidohydrolase [Proteobacteria bacterium]|nr:amidohydrolase [Pseudomonadota bacterium]
MKIDVHAHYWTNDYLDLVAGLGKTDTDTQRNMGAGAGDELAARLALMDRAGVDMQILSACPQMPYSEDRDAAVRVARFVNDQYAALVRAHPDRFRAFVATPMPHMAETIAEIGRGLDELGMVGVCVNTTIMDRPLVDKAFEPFFQELDRRGAILYIHPAGNSCCSPLIAKHQLTWQVGAPMEDTISIMHLITNGIPSRYPNIRIINSHLGGALPMLMQRADNQYGWEAPQTPEKPSDAAKRMWYDTVGHGHVPALCAAIETFGADRLLLGTDFPYESGDIFVRAVDYISDPHVAPEDATRILETNAERLFGFFK